MCDKCFTEEIFSFSSQDDFLAFDKELTFKSDKGIFQILGNIPAEFGDPKFKLLGIGFGAQLFHSYAVYKCNHCNQIWNYSEPDNAWRGYFRKSNVQ